VDQADGGETGAPGFVEIGGDDIADLSRAKAVQIEHVGDRQLDDLALIGGRVVVFVSVLLQHQSNSLRNTR
jgi:hypothetical protein